MSDEDDLRYYKSSQFIPTKGESYSYYECNQDDEVTRYVTYIPETGELDKIDVTWSMELRKEGAEEIDREEFMENWRRSEAADG